ncbi:MAG: hypothetical protein ACOC2J_03935 [bacterium]
MRYFTFSWGNNHIALRGLLRVLGHVLVQPVEVSAGFINNAVSSCPDFMCFSGKIVIAEIIKQLENGERNFIYMSSNGIEACRCAETGSFLKTFFRDKYPDLKTVRIGGNSTDESYQNLQEHFPGISRFKHNYAYFIFFMKLELINMIEKESLRLSPSVGNPYELKKLATKYLKLVDKNQNPFKLYWIGIRFKNAVKKIKRSVDKPVLKIGLVGGEHILSELDSIMAKIKQIVFKANIQLEWRSGFLSITKISSYDRPAKGKDGVDYMKEKTKNYIHPAVYGTELISCARALEFSEEEFDGLIHIYAFGCLPQTAIKPVLQSIVRDKGIPFLSISLGDRFNDSVIETRIEAFIDLLKQRKGEKK